MIEVLKLLNFIYLCQRIVEEFVCGHHGTSSRLNLAFGPSDLKLAFHFKNLHLFVHHLNHVAFGTSFETVVFY